MHFCVCIFAEAENQLVKLSDIIAAKIGGGSDHIVVTARKLQSQGGNLELVPVGTATSFSIWVARPVGRHRWRAHRIVFHTSDSSIITQWVEKINEILSQPGFCPPFC